MLNLPIYKNMFFHLCQKHWHALACKHTYIYIYIYRLDYMKQPFLSDPSAKDMYTYSLYIYIYVYIQPFTILCETTWNNPFFVILSAKVFLFNFMRPRLQVFCQTGLTPPQKNEGIYIINFPYWLCATSLTKAKGRERTCAADSLWCLVKARLADG